MPGTREVRYLPYSPEQMFDLVADVASYPEFLPWVVATRVRSDSPTLMVADMLVGFSALRERFTSRVTKRRPEEICVEYLEGPLKSLENNWKFIPANGGCEVFFAVEFTFRSRLFEALAGQHFDRAFGKMVSAFEARASALYGSSSSSAHSVA